MFEMLDEPGALADALLIMKKNEVSMSWIESFPGPPSGKKRQYLFFADLEGHQNDAKIARTIQGLEKRCAKVVVLGSFPVGVQYD
jgi:chorismate mutase/prephenate dehydratase